MEATKVAPGELPSPKLSDVVSAIGNALVIAKRSMDRLSAEISKEYQQDELLSMISLPFFSLSEVTLHLKFAIQEVKGGEVYVLVDAATLGKMSENAISQMEIKIAPNPIKSYKVE